MKQIGILIAAAMVAAQFILPSTALADGKGVRGVRSGNSQSSGRVAKPRGGNSFGRGDNIRLELPRNNGNDRGDLLRDFADAAGRGGNSNDPRWRNHRNGFGRHGRDWNRDREFARRYNGDISRYDWRDLSEYYGFGRNYSRNDLYNHLYGRDDRISDAYRDAAIANAIASVFGMIVSTTVQPQVVVPVGPVVSAPLYETQQVLVQEGYEVSEKVWVPGYYDERTRTTVEGHYEIHKRWVPPVYETRQVRVR